MSNSLYYHVQATKIWCPSPIRNLTNSMSTKDKLEFLRPKESRISFILSAKEEMFSFKKLTEAFNKIIISKGTTMYTSRGI